MIRLLVILMLFAATAQAQNWQMLGALWSEQAVSSDGYHPTAEADLMLWWTFNSGNGAYQTDVSGKGNYGTQAVSSAQCTISNSAAYFDGGDNLGTVATSLLNGSNSYTCTAWVNLSTWNNYSMVFGGYNAALSGAGIHGIQSDTTSNRRGSAAYNSVNYITSTAAMPSYGNWVFLSASGTRSNLVTIVIDSAFKSTSAGNAAMTVIYPWSVGGLGSYHITGFVDDCRLYSRELSSNEILSVRSEGRQ